MLLFAFFKFYDLYPPVLDNKYRIDSVIRRIIGKWVEPHVPGRVIDEYGVDDLAKWNLERLCVCVQLILKLLKISEGKFSSDMYHHINWKFRDYVGRKRTAQVCFGGYSFELR